MELSSESNSNLFKNLYMLRDEFCDITLEVEGTKFKSHRIILSAVSDYFSTMLRSPNFIEYKMDTISISGVDKVGFSAFLDFVYNKQNFLTPDNVERVLKTATFFMVKDLEKVAIDFMIQSLTVDNAVKFYLISNNYEIFELTKYICGFIHNNKNTILLNGGYLLLPFTVFNDFLNDCDINSEQNLCEIIVDWVKFDMENRLKYFRELLSILFKQPCGDIICHDEVLIETFDEAWKNIVLEEPMHILKFKNTSLMSFHIDVFSYIRSLRWEYSINANLLYAYGCPLIYNNDQMYLWKFYPPYLCFVNITNPQSMVQTCNAANCELKQNMIDLRSVVAIKRSSSQIYVSFLSKTDNYPSLYQYNAETDTLYAINQNNNSNAIHGQTLVNYDNVIYLCGGWKDTDYSEQALMHVISKDKCSNIITLYDPRIGNCQDVGTLLFYQRFLKCTILNGSIYIKGALNQVERFDIIAGKSELVTPTEMPLRYSSTATYNNRIWFSNLDTVQTYNETSKIWKKRLDWNNYFDNFVEQDPFEEGTDWSRSIYLFA